MCLMGLNNSASVLISSFSNLTAYVVSRVDTKITRALQDLLLASNQSSQITALIAVRDAG